MYVKLNFMLFCGIFLLYLLVKKIFKKRKIDPTTRTEPTRVWLVWCGSDIVKKKFELEPNKPIKIDWFKFGFHLNPNQPDPITSLANLHHLLKLVTSLVAFIVIAPLLISHHHQTIVNHCQLPSPLTRGKVETGASSPFFLQLPCKIASLIIWQLDLRLATFHFYSLAVAWRTMTKIPMLAVEWYKWWASLAVVLLFHIMQGQHASPDHFLSLLWCYYTRSHTNNIHGLLLLVHGWRVEEENHHRWQARDDAMGGGPSLLFSQY